MLGITAKLISLTFVIIVCISNTGFAQTCEASGSGRCWYIATNGNNANNGSFAAPFRTVQRGLDALSTPGDVLYIRAGTYHETTFRSGLSGTAQNPISVTGYPGETAIIDGDHSAEPLFIINSQHVVIKNLTAVNGDNSPRGWGYNTILISDSSNIKISNVEVYGTNGACDGNSAQVMLWWSTDLIVENSKIHDSNYQPDSGDHNCGGIGMMGDYDKELGNIKIRNNIIYNMPRGNAVWDKHPGFGNIEVYNNIIYNVYGAATIRQKDVYFHHNRIYHVVNTDREQAIKIYDENAAPRAIKNVTVEYNTFADCAYAAILYSYGKNINLRNNIYYNCTQKVPAGLDVKRTYTICEETYSCDPGASITEVHSDNNCIYYIPTSVEFLKNRGGYFTLAQTRQQFGMDLNSVFADPQFASTDPSSADFLRPINTQCTNMGNFASPASSDISPPGAPSNLTTN